MVDWTTSNEPVGLMEAVAEMELRVADIASGRREESVWLLEHPPLITIGTSGRTDDVLCTDLPVYRVSRGGQVTYHGPGQRIAYIMLDLNRRGRDVRRFVHSLENWVVQALAGFGVRGETRPDRVGVWVRRPDGGEEKIAAIGIRLRRWVSYHGISINVDPNLTDYDSIVPCGIKDHGVTSLAQLGVGASMEDLDTRLKDSFKDIFGG